MTTDSPRLVTLKAAADQLGVSRQRVSQMLLDGDLDGPEVGGTRAAPNIGRVWQWSVDKLIAQRAAAAPPDPRLHHLERRISQLEKYQADAPGPLGEDERRRLLNEIAATKAAGLAINAVLDELVEARDKARRDADDLSVENRRLQVENASLNAQIAGLQRDLANSARSETDKRVAEARSQALTQLLAPSDIEEVMRDG